MTCITTPDLFERALYCFQKTDLAPARALCLEILHADARHFNALHLLGLVELELGDPANAIERFRQSIALNPSQPAAYLNLSHAFLRSGKPQAALTACDAALAQRSDYADALTNRGNALLELKRPAEALASYDRALALKPALGELHTNRGHALRDLCRDAEALASYERAIEFSPSLAPARLGRVEMLRRLLRAEEALACCEELLKLTPDDPEGLLARARVFLDLKRPDAALEDLDQATPRQPPGCAISVIRGNALFQLGRVEEALENYERALECTPGDAEACFNRGNALYSLNRLGAALASYDGAIAANPEFAKAYYYRGNTLRRLERPEESIASYSRVLALDPNDRQAMSAMGDAMRDLNRLPEALAYYDAAIERDPDCIEVLSNRGALLLNLNKPEDAIECFERLLKMDAKHAHYNYTLGLLMHARLLCCDWRDYEPHLAAINAGVDSDERVTLPSLLTVIDDSPPRQLRCARRYVADHWASVDAPPVRGYGHQRIRLAYLSADFREHPVAQLMAGVLEGHDRERFETFGISLRASDGSALRRRVEAAVDQFMDVSGQSDRDVAARLRELEIDIAIDLTGYTEGLRPGIFARRAAPVQVNYLGFPGTLAASYMDYLIADSLVIPAAAEEFYTESIVLLPQCFLPAGSPSLRAPRTPSRSECCLPERGFVFCCFNNHHKILPAMFDVWMRLLGEVEGSVLWLPQGSEPVTRNLYREAEARGIAAERLVFAPRLADMADHLARYRLADLFLDTLPYNAHKTTVDALWAGVPVVTCRGHSFAGRVAGSLLSTAGLSELVADSLPEYEALVLRLASSSELLAGIRNRLAESHATSPLFKAERYVRHLESAFVSLWERAERAEAPSRLVVQSSSG